MSSSRLHVYKSVYDLLYDFSTSRKEIRFLFLHQLELYVYTFQEKLMEN
jgi:hypothetical protein